MVDFAKLFNPSQGYQGGQSGQYAGNTNTATGGTMPTGQPGQGGFMNFLGGESFANGAGAFNTVMQGITGFMGLKQARSKLKFQKKTFNLNYDAGRQDYANQWKDKWAARDSAAVARGAEEGSFGGGMDQWVGDRNIADRDGNNGGTIPGRQDAPAGFSDADRQIADRRATANNRGV